MAGIPAKYNSDCSFVIEGRSKDSKAKSRGCQARHTCSVQLGREQLRAHQLSKSHIWKETVSASQFNHVRLQCLQEFFNI